MDVSVKTNSSSSGGALPQCTVCFEELADELTAAPCGHVFHSICIDQWHRVNPTCPVCKIRLPKQLLRLFFEHQAPVVSDAVAPSVAVEGERGGGEGGEGVQPVSAEVTRLQRQVISSNKAIEASMKLCSVQKEKLKACQKELRDMTLDSVTRQEQLQTLLHVTEGKLQTAQIDGCKKNKEFNRLKREMEGIKERLRKCQGEKVTHQYLSQFGSQASSLGGLGQVDVEVVLRQMARDDTHAETIIRGQHAQLSKTMEREQRTKRELLKARREGEAVSSELEDARSKATKSKKEVRQLEKALAKARGELRDREIARSPSVGSFLDSAKRKPSSQDGRKNGWALSQKLEGGHVWANIREGAKRGSVADRTKSVDTDESLMSADCFPRAKRRAVTLEREDDLVSLESEEDGSSDDADEEEEKGSAPGDRCRWKPDAASCRQLDREARFNSTTQPLSFLKKAALGGSAERQKPGKYIVTGFNAVGGRHSVRASSPKTFSLNRRLEVARSSRERNLAAGRLGLHKHQ